MTAVDDGLIRFNCLACSKTIKVPVSAAGRHGKCPACGTALVVPAIDSAPPAAVVTQATVDNLQQIAPPLIIQTPAKAFSKKWFIILCAIGLLIFACVAPWVLLTFGTLGLVLTVAYFVVPKIREKIDVSTGYPSGELRTPLLITAPILLIGLLLSWRVLTVKYDRLADEEKHRVAGTTLLASAKDAHSKGQLESAIDRIRRARMELSISMDGYTEAATLADQYGRELGFKREPALQMLIADARTLYKSGDHIGAIAKLESLSDFDYAPSYGVARDLKEEWKRVGSSTPSKTADTVNVLGEDYAKQHAVASNSALSGFFGNKDGFITVAIEVDKDKLPWSCGEKGFSLRIKSLPSQGKERYCARGFRIRVYTAKGGKQVALYDGSNRKTSLVTLGDGSQKMMHDECLPEFAFYSELIEEDKSLFPTVAKNKRVYIVVDEYNGLKIVKEDLYSGYIPASSLIPK